jgi:hypothetical protein
MGVPAVAAFVTSVVCGCFMGHPWDIAEAEQPNKHAAIPAVARFCLQAP